MPRLPNEPMCAFEEPGSGRCNQRTTKDPIGVTIETTLDLTGKGSTFNLMMYCCERHERYIISALGVQAMPFAAKVKLW